MDVHRLQTDLLRQHREGWSEFPPHERAYAALLLALHLRAQTKAALSRKGALSETDARRIAKMRRDTVLGKRGVRKEGGVQRFIRLRLATISHLREEGLSWREISTYLAAHHKRHVSHTMIHREYGRLSGAEVQEAGGPGSRGAARRQASDP